MRRAWLAAAAVAITAVHTAAQRASDGHPDLQGLWTNGTLTPLERPADFANRFVFTEAEATEFERTGLERFLKTISDLNRATAGDLDGTYVDTQGLKVVDGRRTALIVDPADGTLPRQIPAAEQRAAKRPPRTWDDPEARTVDERCLVGMLFGGSSAAPPMVPNPIVSNYYQIVQTPQYLLIYTELVHDARIVRIGGSHVAENMRGWLGDSIGRWEGDTLVVDTTNFTDKTHYRGSSERLHVVERFRRTDATTIQYRATVEDPDTWATAWTLEIPFKATDNRIFEYACHEGNYSMEYSLRGMRAKEKDDEATARKK